MAGLDGRVLHVPVQALYTHHPGYTCPSEPRVCRTTAGGVRLSNVSWGSVNDLIESRIGTEVNITEFTEHKLSSQSLASQCT